MTFPAIRNPVDWEIAKHSKAPKNQKEGNDTKKIRQAITGQLTPKRCLVAKVLGTEHSPQDS